METVNMQDAKSSLSRLVQAVERGSAREIIIARNGQPAARLVPLAPSAKQRIGVARGKFQMPEDTEAGQAEVTRLFLADNNVP